MTTQDEIDNLLHYVPILIRSDLSDWEREFCISIAGRMKRGTFTPSEKQIDVLRRLVSEFQTATMQDAPIIEGGA